MDTNSKNHTSLYFIGGMIFVVLIIFYALIIKPNVDRVNLKNCLNNAENWTVEKFIQATKEKEYFPSREDCYRIYKD